MPSRMGSSSAVGGAASTLRSSLYPRCSDAHTRKRFRSFLLMAPMGFKSAEEQSYLHHDTQIKLLPT